MFIIKSIPGASDFNWFYVGDGRNKKDMEKAEKLCTTYSHQIVSNKKMKELRAAKYLGDWHPYGSNGKDSCFECGGVNSEKYHDSTCSWYDAIAMGD